MRRLLAAILCTIALQVAQPPPARADDTLTLILGSPAPSLANMPLLIAEHEGFYRQEHLDVVTQLAANPSVCAQLVASGKGDVCSMTIEPIIAGYEKGLQLKLFLSRLARFSYVLAVLDDSPIKTLADFNGQVLGEISAGSPAEIVAQSMLTGVGLKKDAVTFVPIGFGAQGLEALVSKRVAGVAYSYFELVPYEVVAHQKLRIYYHPILNDVSDVGYAASPATIAGKADALARFSRALVKASIFLRENPAASARIFLESTQPGKFTETDVRLDTQELAVEHDYFPAADPASKRIGALSPQGIAFLSKALADAGVTHQIVPVQAIMTNQFVDFANAFDHKALIAFAKSAR
jgi:ABC-type nitrate/sulfonate/bicarbonate transport system substrate-binding protein